MKSMFDSYSKAVLVMLRWVYGVGFTFEGLAVACFAFALHDTGLFNSTCGAVGAVILITTGACIMVGALKPKMPV